MVRVSTAVAVLLSFLAAPLTSAACMARCGSFLVHQHPPGHEKTYAYVGPHVHHMSHVHVVNPEEEPSVGSRQEQPKHITAPMACPNGTCATKSEAVPGMMAVRSATLQASIFLQAITVDGSLPISPQNLSNKASASSKIVLVSTSAPLRI